MKPRDYIEHTAFAKGRLKYVYRRMASQRLKKFQQAKKLLGRDWTHKNLARPPHWAFGRPPRPDRDPRSASFTRYDPKSLVLKSEAEVDRWLDAGLQYDRELDSICDDEAVLNGERDAARKISVQRGTTVWWHVFRLGPGDYTRPPELWMRALRHVLALYKKHNANLPVEDETDPAETNGGWPLCVAGPIPKICAGLAVAGVKTAEDAIAAAGAYGDALGVGDSLCGFALASRTGAQYDPDGKDEWRFVGRSAPWESTTRVAGAWTRTRPVLMGPSVLQRLLRRLYLWMKGGRMNLPGCWHAGKQDADRARRAKATGQQGATIEIDASNLDGTVRRSLQQAIADEIAKIEPSLAEECKLWVWAEGRPTISPSWDLNSDEVTLAESAGGVHSGVKTTSEQDTLICIVTDVYACALQGIPIESWPDAGPYANFYQGDDGTKIPIRPGVRINPKDYAAAWADVGLIAKIFTGDRFLMRHLLLVDDVNPDEWPEEILALSENVSGAPVGARQLEQSGSNEKEPTLTDAKEHVIEGLLIAGQTARLTGSQRQPLALQRGVHAGLMSIEWIARSSADDLPGLGRWLVTPEQMAKVKAALEHKAGQAALRRAARASDRGSTERALVTLATRLGVSVEDALAEDRRVEDIVRRAIARMSAPEARRAAVAGAKAMIAGPDAATTWLGELGAYLETRPPTQDDRYWTERSEAAPPKGDTTETPEEDENAGLFDEG